jgi:hypothetical protein
VPRLPSRTLETRPQQLSTQPARPHLAGLAAELRSAFQYDDDTTKCFIRAFDRPQPGRKMQFEQESTERTEEKTQAIE